MFKIFAKRNQKNKSKFGIGDTVIVKDLYSPIIIGKIIAFAESLVYIENKETKEIYYVYKSTFYDHAAILKKYEQET